jgi:hypothetical protein
LQIQLQRLCHSIFPDVFAWVTGRREHEYALGSFCVTYGAAKLERSHLRQRDRLRHGVLSSAPPSFAFNAPCANYPHRLWLEAQLKNTRADHLFAPLAS